MLIIIELNTDFGQTWWLDAENFCTNECCLWREPRSGIDKVKCRTVACYIVNCVQETSDPIMCSYKLVSVKFEVWGLQTRVEGFVQQVTICIYLQSFDAKVSIQSADFLCYSIHLGSVCPLRNVNDLCMHVEGNFKIKLCAIPTVFLLHLLPSIFTILQSHSHRVVHGKAIRVPLQWLSLDTGWHRLLHGHFNAVGCVQL